MGRLRSRSVHPARADARCSRSLLAYGVQRYVVGIFRVPTGSMARTLLPGDRLLAARFWYSIERPTRGDIVVLHPNGQGERVFYADARLAARVREAHHRAARRLGEGAPRARLDLHRARRQRLRAR